MIFTKLKNQAGMAHVVSCLLLYFATADSVRPQQPDSLERNYAAELPRTPPQEPEEALRTFELVDGYQIELVASEPEIRDPVAMEFDEHGRLYVVEMRGYSEQFEENLGSVRLLEDLDQDGRYETSHVFADGLAWPTAVCCWRGGVFVGVAPDIWYFKDTDGDGKADIRERVLTGFGGDNVQGLLNSFRWGYDRRIHFATSSNGALVRRPGQTEAETIRLRGVDGAFDPETMDLVPTSGGGQHGLSFDRWGRKFVCSNSDHLQVIAYDLHYAERNPLLAPLPTRRSIAADGPAAEVFRISPPEPWRIVRTRLRVQGLVTGPIEGGGRAAGYFTGASGVTLFEGDGLAAEDVGRVFVGDVGGNLVHRKQLVEDRFFPQGVRVDGGREFLASTDHWFRPVQFAQGPDGGLYILDMYREVIEHPWSLPETIKQHLDLTSGRDRGRIYHVTYRGRGHGNRALPGSVDAEKLVSMLDHPNAWHRRTAFRLFAEQSDTRHQPRLEALLNSGESTPEGRLLALSLLAGHSPSDPDWMISGIQNSHPRVREFAVRLSENVPGCWPKLETMLLELVQDADARVRRQWAFSLGAWPASPQRLEALSRLAEKDGQFPEMRFAILSSVTDIRAALFARLLRGDALRHATHGQILLTELARQIGASFEETHDGEFSRALATLPSEDARWTRHYARTAWNAASEQQAMKVEAWLPFPLLENVENDATDGNSPEMIRLSAIELLGRQPVEASLETLAGLLSQREPPRVQQTALRSLARLKNESAPRIVLAQWYSLGPDLKRDVLDLLFGRRTWLARFFDALEDGTIHPRDLDITARQRLLNHEDPVIQRRAERLFPARKNESRQVVVEHYLDVLDLAGNPTQGQAVYRKHCAGCHAFRGEGHAVGPALETTLGRTGEQLLTHLLDPNREVDPRYVGYIARTIDGIESLGLLSRETPTHVTVTRAFGHSNVVPREAIDILRSTGVSLMPEGLEQQISRQGLADLLAFLRSDPSISPPQ